ncbi:MAG: nuclease [Terriglobales bacterium]
MKRLRTIALVMIVVMLYGHIPVEAWGNEGHTMISRVAAQKVPAAMPKFMRDASERLAYLGPEPDRWRSTTEPWLKYAQEPDHFIDFERIPPDFGELPQDRYYFMRRLFEKRAIALLSGVDKKKADELLPDKVGLQPYATMEVYGRLKVAFREYRRLQTEKKDTSGVEQNIVLYAGWLGHYVADGSQPLHTTVNYDGWVEAANPNGYRTEKGIHWEFEGPYVGKNFTDKDFAGLVSGPVQLKDPFLDYQKYLKDSFALVPKVYELDKAGGFKEAGTLEAREFTRQRLAAGSQMLLNLWYTAWMESAIPLPERERPAPSPATNPPTTKPPTN